MSPEAANVIRVPFGTVPGGAEEGADEAVEPGVGEPVAVEPPSPLAVEPPAPEPAAALRDPPLEGVPPVAPAAPGPAVLHPAADEASATLQAASTAYVNRRLPPRDMALTLSRTASRPGQAGFRADTEVTGAAAD